MAFQDSMNKFNRGAVGQGLGAFFQGTSRADIQQQQQTLDEGRKGAMAKDAQAALAFMKAGDYNSANALISQRSEMIGQLGGDPSDTIELQQRLQAGDYEGVTNDLMTVVDAATAGGYIDPMDAANLDYTKARTAALQATTAGGGTKPAGQIEF
jgi:hypothetical protein